MLLVTAEQTAVDPAAGGFAGSATMLSAPLVGESPVPRLHTAMRVAPVCWSKQPTAIV
jgi:hypothetical protein